MRYKNYDDYLQEYKDNIEEWVKWYKMSYKESFDGIKDFLILAPMDYRDDLYKDLKKWSMENEKLAK